MPTRVEHLQHGKYKPGPAFRLILDEREPFTYAPKLMTAMATVINQAMRSRYWEVRAACAENRGEWHVIDTCYAILDEKFPGWGFDQLSGRRGVLVYGWRKERKSCN